LCATRRDTNLTNAERKTNITKQERWKERRKIRPSRKLKEAAV
jgi:hypothetical protein